jgi:TPR repeat protein
MTTRPLRREPAPAGGRFGAAAAAEDRYRRMWTLRQMDEGQLRALLSGPTDQAAPWIESAARYGVTQAQLRLGQMLLDGNGMARDEAAALRWFERAAGRGSPEAMNMAGRCRENGWGAAIDLAAAARWYRASAEAGHDWGQYNYANMLFDGRGVVRDPVQAAAWYRRAADHGHARAMNLLARCCEEGWGVPRDPAQAYQWYERAAQGGYFRAQFNLGAILAGLGEIDRALPWFERALAVATPDSRPAMVQALARQADPRLARLGRGGAEA